LKSTSLRTRVFLGIIIGIILGTSSFIVTTTISNQLSDSPLSATIFPDIVENGDYPSFNMTNMAVYDPSYRIESKLWNQSHITFDEAEGFVMSFLRFNLEESVLENTSTTIGHKIEGAKPTWVLVIEGPYLRTLLRANAITGEIIDWDLYSASLSITNSTPIDSISEAEEIAYEFLRMNNYSIPYNAKYIGVKQFSYFSYSDDYYVEFQHFEDLLYVGGPWFNPDSPPPHTNEGILLRVSKSIGQVTQFGFHWTVVDAIPKTGLISQREAESIALNNRSYTDAIILESRLLLTEVESCVSSDGVPQLRVSWVIAVNVSNNLRVQWVDAFSGEFLQEMRTNGMPDHRWPTNDTLIPSYSIIALAIMLSIMTAFGIWYSLQRRTYLE